MNSVNEHAERIRKQIWIMTAVLVITSPVDATGREHITSPGELTPAVRELITSLGVRVGRGEIEKTVDPAGAVDPWRELRRREARQRAFEVFHSARQEDTRFLLSVLNPTDVGLVLNLPIAAAYYIAGRLSRPAEIEVESYLRKLQNDRTVVEQGMSDIEAQALFARAFEEAARKHGGRRCAVRSIEHSGQEKGLAAIVENNVRLLRLERSVDEESYSLVVEVETRVFVRGQIVYEECSGYRSGPAELCDWAFKGAEPLKIQFDRACAVISDRLAAKNLPRGQKMEAYPHWGLALVRVFPLQSQDALRLGRVGIISTCGIPNIAFQRPLTKSKAARYAREQWADGVNVSDGLPVIQTIVGLSFAPFALGAQAHGKVSGFSPSELTTTDQALTAAAHQLKLQPMFRERVLNLARAATDQPLIEVAKPFPKGQEQEFAQMRGVMAGTLAWLPSGQSATYYLRSQGIDTVLELEIVQPALSGRGEVNPRLSFHAGLRATLWSVATGNELASCELSYRSVEHKFRRWAEHDARLFRQELVAFVEQASAAVVQHLAIPAWNSQPRPTGIPVLAKRP